MRAIKKTKPPTTISPISTSDSLNSLIALRIMVAERELVGLFAVTMIVWVYNFSIEGSSRLEILAVSLEEILRT